MGVRHCSPAWGALAQDQGVAGGSAFGVEVLTQLCEKLIAGGAPAIHFYTLNQSALALEICKRLAA